MRTMILALAAASTAFTAVPAEAKKRHRGYDQAQRYYQTDNGIRYWQEDGRNYCRKPDGTVGLLIGGAAGALVGRAVDTHGDRATGTIIGAAAGALLGREVAQNRARCR